MTTDPKSAEAFYSKVVGWTAQAWEQDPSYKMWKSGDRSTGGLMAQRVENGAGPAPQWFCYIGTPDVDTTITQTVNLGGKIMRPAMDLPNVGRFAFLSDPQGAAFAAFTPAGSSADQPRPADPKLGDFSWHELLTTNAQAAWEFYSKLFGWEKTSAMDMGGGNMYQMFGLGGVPFGGMFTAKANPKPFWLPYALVRDSKQAAETIKQAGGTVTNGPMEVPGGDWIVAGLDPQGASFAVQSKAPAAA